jgi:hypothetical protein
LQINHHKKRNNHSSSTILLASCAFEDTDDLDKADLKKRRPEHKGPSSLIHFPKRSVHQIQDDFLFYRPFSAFGKRG